MTRASFVSFPHFVKLTEYYSDHKITTSTYLCCVLAVGASNYKVPCALPMVCTQHGTMVQHGG